MGKEIIMSYDKDADVFYISLGKPRDAVGREVKSGVIERVDPKNNEVVGFTIVDFSKKFKKKKELKVPIKLAL